MHDTRDDQLVELAAPGKPQWRIEPTGESDDDGNPCYAAVVFDGANRGMWISNAVVALARDYGWPDCNSQEDIDAANGGEALLLDTAQYAEQYLNNLTPAGWTFGFSDGDFFLANDAWWAMASS